MKIKMMIKKKKIKKKLIWIKTFTVIPILKHTENLVVIIEKSFDKIKLNEIWDTL